MHLLLLIILCLVLHEVHGSNPTPQPTKQPTFDPTSQPTRSPSSQPSRQPSRQPTSRPSAQPSKQPMARPSGQPSGSPTSSPSNPSSNPTNQPTKQPVSHPTSQPSSLPTSQPSFHPLAKPTSRPSQEPTSQPSNQPSRQPSSHPTTPTSHPSSQPSMQPSEHPTSQPSSTPSAQPSRAPTIQPTAKPSRQPTSHPSAQPSRLPSSQPSAQPFSKPTSQPSVQPSTHPSSQPSVQPSSKPSTQPSSVPSTQPSTQPSSEPTNPTTQPSCQPSVQPSTQPSSQPSTQPSDVPTIQPSTQPTAIPSCQPSSTPTTQPSVEPSSQPTIQPSTQPTGHPSRQPSAQPSEQPSTQPSSAPSGQPSSTPTVQPSTQPTSQPTRQPSNQPTSKPSAQPSAQPTAVPSMQPTSRPSCQPSATPTVQPSTQPTSQPTRQPSQQPTSQPSRAPTAQPSHAPSRQPTAKPSRQPTTQPSAQPSRLPSSQPSVQPSMQPTSRPSRQPSMQPSGSPTRQPSAQPSGQPSTFPSSQPSRSPTCQPSSQPTRQPSNQPSSAPSLQPAAVPTSIPSTQPSNQPSSQPTSPTSRPTMQPSTQPTAVPSLQPSASPTSRPSPLPPCPKGSFYNLTGHSIAGNPVTGYYHCTPCRAGTFQGLDQMSFCEITPPGSFSKQGAIEPQRCPLNSYAETNGSDACVGCPKGEFIGVTGSFSAKDCMDPAINFIMGSVAFLAAVFAIIVYMWFGRLHRIAFQRKFRLIRKLIMMYGTVLTTADMITRAGTMLTAIQGIRVDKNSLRERVFKPFIFFFLVFFVIIPGVTALFVLQSSLRIIFNAMVLFRAYKQIYNKLADLNFSADFLHPFLALLEDVFPYNAAIYYLSWPAVKLLENISVFSINLNKVKVTCPGAQSPLYLLTDMIIVAVVILVIESDVHVFWTMMITPAVSKIRSMVFSAQYFRRFFCSTLGYLSLAMLITQLPDPAKLVQYSMSFVVISSFFNMKGKDYGGWVNASKSCDGAVPIPMDSILANLSAIFAIIVLPAVVYLISVVLFALKDDRPRSSGVLSRLSLGHSPSKHASAPPLVTDPPGSPTSAMNPTIPAPLSPVSAAAPGASDKPATSQWCTAVDCCGPWYTTTARSEVSTGPVIQMEGPDAGPACPTQQHALLSPGSQTTGSAGALSPLSSPTKTQNKDKRGNSKKAADDSSSDSDSDFGVNVADFVDVESPRKNKNNNPRFSVSFDDDWNTATEGIRRTTSDVGTPSRPDSRTSDGRSSPTPQTTGRNSPVPQGPRPLSPESATSSYSHRSFGTPSAKRKGLNSLHVKETEEEQHSISADLSKFLRAVSSFFALDWLFFAGVYHLGHYVFKSQQDFLTSKYMVHTAYRRERFDVKTSSKKVQVYVDAFEYDKNLKELRTYAASAQLRPPPLYDGFVGTDSAETIADRKREDDEWEQEKKTLPSYFEMTMEVNNEMKTFEWQEKYMPYSRHILCHWMPMQLCTEAGRKSWLRVFQTYFGMFLLCFGIWPEWLVEDFKIVERFEEFHRLNEMIYSQIGRKMFTSKVEDAFTKIENDEKVSFGNFVAAITTCRIALLQIMPALTVWSLFASAVASTPLFVSSKTMDDLLPPLLALNTYKTACDLLREDYGREPSRFQTAFLSYYLFINQSRIIQFVINGFLNAVSIVLIFNRDNLKFLIPPMAFVMLHQGLLSSVYVTLLFKKLLFPVVTEETRAGGEARTAAELVQMEAPDPHAEDDHIVSMHDIALMENTVTESPDGPDTPLGRFSPRRDASLRMQDLQSIKRRGSSDSRQNLHNNGMHSMGSMGSMSVEDTPAPVMPVKGSLWRRSSALDASDWSLPTSVSDTNLAAAAASTRNSPTPDTPLSAGQMKAFPI